jgi:hypothetical protein
MENVRNPNAKMASIKMANLVARPAQAKKIASFATLKDALLVSMDKKLAKTNHAQLKRSPVYQDNSQIQESVRYSFNFTIMPKKCPPSKNCSSC